VDTVSSFTVGEQTEALYVMGDAGTDTDIYHANFGIRVVRTELNIDNAQSAPFPTFAGTASWNGVNANNQPIAHSRKYTDVLPSFNFVFDITEAQKFRFGAARVVAPQNLMQLGLGNSYNFTRGADGPGGAARFQFANGASGNPNLDPFRASQFNMSWEDYISAGIVSVGFFYKQVDNFVSIANIPTFVPDDFGGTTNNVTTPVNGGKGKIYGAEIGGQYSFGGGFGIAANYTRSTSESDQDTSFATDIPIPGVSKDSLNFTAFFERFGFSARASYSWRSKAVNSSLVGSTFPVPTSNPDPAAAPQIYGVYAASYGQLDGQIGYDFGDKFGVALSVVNLTNEKQHTYLQFPNLPFTYDDTGRRLFFGFKAKM
jgi:TonB-dependent receptor